MQSRGDKLSRVDGRTDGRKERRVEGKVGAARRIVHGPCRSLVFRCRVVQSYHIRSTPAMSNAHDLTSNFRSIVGSHPRAAPPNPHKPPSSNSQAVQVWQKRRQAEAQWTGEANKLLSAAQQLHTFVSSVRKPYLNLDARNDHHQYDGTAPPREFGAEDGDARPSSTSVGPSSYTDLAHLSDTQRDEVDLHLKLVLEKSIARLKELIVAEERRRAAVPSTPSSTLARLFAPAASPTTLDSVEYSAQLGQHRDSVTSYIGASLKRAGERIGKMQAARVRALEEKAGKRRIAEPSSSAVGRQQQTRAEIAVPGSTSSFRATAAGQSVAESSAATAHEELTQEQMQLFASESSALTKTLQSDLAAVENVTRTLNTIAELQTTLVQHLTTQNETIASLADEAIDQRIEVESGNTQLKQARERNRSANRLLAAFLVGSGLGLLFLHGKSREMERRSMRTHEPSAHSRRLRRYEQRTRCPSFDCI